MRVQLDVVLGRGAAVLVGIDEPLAPVVDEQRPMRAVGVDDVAVVYVGAEGVAALERLALLDVLARVLVGDAGVVSWRRS
jgi:hypothetical protein